MNKDTIELERNPNHLLGIGRLEEPHSDDPSVLDAIVQWSQGKHVSVYRHRLRRAEENPRPNDIHIHDGRQYTRCDLVFYIDVYYQPSA